MNPTVQSFVALAIVAVTAAWLLLRSVTKKKNSGCGGNCGAVSPEVRKLQAHLKRQP